MTIIINYIFIIERIVAITFHPKIGQILMCDFPVDCFIVPEMVKKRPVLVVSSIPVRENLVTIVPLSGSEPDPVKNYHYKILKKSLPQLGNFQEKDSWVKGDMIYTVGFHRLDLILLGKRDPNTGKRQYFNQKLSREAMKEIYKCILCGLNLRDLGQYL